jgi:DNA polymerase-1
MAKRATPTQRSLFDDETEVSQDDAKSAVIVAHAPTDTATVIATQIGMAIAPTAKRSPAPPPKSLAGRTVWVVDAHSLIHQVFHAIGEMTSPRGEPVNAVFGFTRDLLFLLESKKPDYLFCAFDLPGKTFRHDLYEQYKGHRPDMDDDLKPQIGKTRQAVEALGLPVLAAENFEADDVVATVARATDELSGRCFIVTGDKDCRQLITDNVMLYNIRKNEFIDRDYLQRDWGIEPGQVVDYQALVGDSTDNVPGVPQIGPKAAKELLDKYGTLDGVYEHIEEITAKARKETLVRNRELAYLSQRMVRLDTHTPVAIDWRPVDFTTYDPRPALQLFQELGFRRFGDRWLALGGKKASSVAWKPPATVGTVPAAGMTAAVTEEIVVVETVKLAPTYRTIDTPEGLQDLVETIKQQKRISVDTETTHVWPRWAELVGISLAWNETEGYYIPLRAPAGERTLDERATLEALRPVLEDPTIEKLGQNLKYDRIVLRTAGVDIQGPQFDTMVASYLLDAGARNHNLDDLARRYMNHTTIKIAELIGTGKQQKRMDEVPVAQITDYAAEDALVPIHLRPLLEKRMQEDGQTTLFTDVEMPIIDVLVELESNGIKVDCQRLGELSKQFGDEMLRIEQEIYAIAGHELNISSPKQLQEVLFNELKLPVMKKTAKTGPSTDADVLEALAPLHPLPAKIVEYRQYAKLKGTYVDALPTMVHPQTGRVHTSFNQVVAATGRLSSSDPNLQNIPVRTEAGRAIRSAFVPGIDGWTLLAADYSQIELRVLAHYSEDERLCEAFLRDEDIHARVAGQVNNVPIEQVTSDMRRQAKLVNFGTIYGQGSTALAQQLGIDRQTAKRFIDSYFQTYPGIERFLIESLAQCRKQGYAATILGRRRAIEGIREGAGRSRNLAERTAVNAIIQGSAADLMKLAMINIHRRLKREQFPAHMLLQIHDELIFEVDGKHVEGLARLVTEEMSCAYKLRVPLKVDVKMGPNWRDAEEAKVAQNYSESQTAPLPDEALTEAAAEIFRQLDSDEAPNG